MNNKLIIELIKRGWQEGHYCYYTKIGNFIVYYNVTANTFYYSFGSNSTEIYLGEGSLELLEEIESEDHLIKLTIIRNKYKM